jgi:hypothetical protein
MSRTDNFFSDLFDVERVLIDRREAGGRSLHDRLRSWEWCVDTISTDSTMMAYEFINMLDTRKAIEESIVLLPDRLAQKMRVFVGVLDEAFRRSTVEDGGQEISKYTTIGEDQSAFWWWIRKPIRLPKGW